MLNSHHHVQSCSESRHPNLRLLSSSSSTSPYTAGPLPRCIRLIRGLFGLFAVFSSFVVSIFAPLPLLCCFFQSRHDHYLIFPQFSTLATPDLSALDLDYRATLCDIAFDTLSNDRKEADFSCCISQIPVHLLAVTTKSSSHHVFQKTAGAQRTGPTGSRPQRCWQQHMRRLPHAQPR